MTREVDKDTDFKYTDMFTSMTSKSNTTFAFNGIHKFSSVQYITRSSGSILWSKCNTLSRIVLFDMDYIICLFLDASANTNAIN